jgi:hypothetical protein
MDDPEVLVDRVRDRETAARVVIWQTRLAATTRP